LPERDELEEKSSIVIDELSICPSGFTIDCRISEN